MIELWPMRPGGDWDWTDAYLRQVSALVDQFIPQFNVDTNRIYLRGGSEVYAVWNPIAMKPGFFAGATFAAGPQGSRPAALKDVPVWAPDADGRLRPDPSDADVGRNHCAPELDWRRPALPDSTGHRFNRRRLDGFPIRRHSAADIAGHGPRRFLSHCWPIEHRASLTG